MLNVSDKKIIHEMIMKQKSATPGIVNQYRDLRADNQEQIFRAEIVCTNKDEDEELPIGVGTETVAT